MNSNCHLKFLNFHFFSDENIEKFTNISSVISKEISNLNLPPYFDSIFNNLSENFRSNTMRDLVTEYNEFKKFYKVNEERFGKRRTFTENDDELKDDEKQNEDDDGESKIVKTS